ncbi:MAG: cupredoxin domain-containing protein [Actinobacteria bacterium]|nr:cupredoxin domain-containing protein [Actinomycetota bacterium]
MTTSLMVALLVGTAACGNAGSGPATDAAAPSSASAGQQDGAVTIKTFAFHPDPVRVKAGTTVSWTNEDEILHNVTSGERDEADGTFDKQLDGPGSVAEHTFDTPGTYAYHCSIHPGMDGVVEVSSR